MFTEIDLNAPQTIAFRKYIISALAKRVPLSVGDLIEVTIIEESNDFPKIRENPLKDADGKIITTLETIANERLPFTFEGEHMSKTVQIMDAPSRESARRDVVCKYLETAFDDVCTVKLPHILSQTPLTIKIPFLIKHPDKIYAEHEDEEKTLYLDGAGNLWREPKDINCYAINAGSRRYKIIRFFADKQGYHKIGDIAQAIGGGDETQIRNDITKIRQNITRFVHIKGDSVIKTKSGSGYGIVSPYKIIRA